MRSALTDISVRALKPVGKQFKVWDTKTPGFGIIIGSATKSWFVVYGRSRKFKAIGRYPEMSLADARAAAKRLLIERSDRGASKSFGEALDLYYVVMSALPPSSRRNAKVPRRPRSALSRPRVTSTLCSLIRAMLFNR